MEALVDATDIELSQGAAPEDTTDVALGRCYGSLTVDPPASRLTEEAVQEAEDVFGLYALADENQDYLIQTATGGEIRAQCAEDFQGELDKIG